MRVRLTRNVEDVQGVVEDSLARVLQHPVIARRIAKVLAGEVRRADHYGPGDAIGLFQRRRPDAVQRRTHATEVGEVQFLARMLLLVAAQRNQPLSPVEIAVGKQRVAPLGPNEDIEIGEIVWGVAQAVGGLRQHGSDQQRLQGSLTSRILPERGARQQDKGIYGEDVPVANVDARKNREEEKNGWE